MQNGFFWNVAADDLERGALLGDQAGRRVGRGEADVDRAGDDERVRAVHGAGHEVDALEARLLVVALRVGEELARELDVLDPGELERELAVRSGGHGARPAAAALLLAAPSGAAVPPQAARAPRLSAPRPLEARKLRRVDFEVKKGTGPPGLDVNEVRARHRRTLPHRLKSAWRRRVSRVTDRFLRSPCRVRRGFGSSPRNPLGRAGRALECRPRRRQPPTRGPARRHESMSQPPQGDQPQQPRPAGSAAAGQPAAGLAPAGQPQQGYPQQQGGFPPAAGPTRPAPVRGRPRSLPAAAVPAGAVPAGPVPPGPYPQGPQPQGGYPPGQGPEEEAHGPLRAHRRGRARADPGRRRRRGEPRRTGRRRRRRHDDQRRHGERARRRPPPPTR